MNAQLPRFADAGEAFAWLAGASAQAAVLIVVVLALRVALGRRLTPGWRLALWLIVLLRLVVPLAVESRWNLAALGRRVASSISRSDVAITTAKPRAVSSEPRVSITYGPVPGVAPPAVAPRVAVRSATPWSTRDAVVGAWLAGVAAMLLRETIGAIRLGRVVRRMRRIDDPMLLALAARCAREAGVRRRVRLVETDRLRSPAVCGIVRPTILLPVDVARTLSPAELRLVLLHEFVHVRRGDALVGALARLVRAMHWFNPFVWLGVAAFRADRELAADAAVLRVVGDAERRAYGDCLLHVVARVSGTPRHPATLGLFGPSRYLQRRIDMIAIDRPDRSWFARAVRALLGAIAVGAIGATAAAGESDAAPSSMRPAPTTRAADDHEKADEALLGQFLPDLPLAGKTFDGAADALSAATHVPIRVEWDRLAAVGVTRLTLVPQSSLTSVRLGRSLDIALQQLISSADGGRRPLDYEVVDNGIVVSTPADIDARFGFTTRTLAVPAALQGKTNDEIASMIVGNYDFMTWKRFGGRGDVEVRDGKVIVTNTRRRVASVAALLRSLRVATPATTAPADEIAARTILPEVRFDRVPLADAVEFLKETTHVPLVVDWSSIERTGGSKDMSVTAHMKNASLNSVLMTLCKSSDDEKLHLGVAMHNGVVTIAARAAEDGTAIDTRTYDVRDLLIEIPDFQAPAATQPAATRPTRDERSRQLIDVIQSTIESDSWKSNGGLIGAIQEMSGQLVVTSTPAIQARIGALLDALRRGRSLQVVVEARFIAVDPASVPTLLGGGGSKPVALAAEPGDASKVAGAFLDDAQAAALLRSLQLSDATSTLTAPKLTLFNGQNAFVRVETTHAYVSAFTVSVPAAGGRRYEPVIENARTGVTLAVRATASADHRYVTLELDPRTSRLIGLESVPFAGDAASGLSVQRPNVEETSLATTLSLPTGGTVLLGGAQVAGGTRLFADAIDATTKTATTRPGTRELLLLVTARVIEPTPEP